MTRRRHLHAVITTVAVAVAATACSDDDGDDADDTPVETTTPVTEPDELPQEDPDEAAPVTDAPDDPPGDDVTDNGYRATIQRTTDGVPHITGDTFADVVFGQGYASAEDHACDLIDQVIKVHGQRAATVGAGDEGEHVESDFQWRALGIADIASADYAGVSDDLRSMFDGFAAGWSSYVEEVGTDGLSGWCAGEDWLRPITGEEVYVYARSITLLASGTNVAQFIVSASPPDAGAPDEGEPVDDESAAALGTGFSQIASNGWALGSDAVEGGEGGMLLANPHFPWEGERRFWESHLIVPGEIDIYGAMLIGLPGIGIGFTDSFAWTHTVSAGNRFTAYTLDLDPDDPTSYLVDGESREMEPIELSVEVLQDDGSIAEESRTVWSSEYGPIIDFPGVGWTDEMVLTYRDANIDNDEFADQYATFAQAGSLDEFIDAHREHQGVPLFNTIAVSRDGRAWYADTSATPNLSDEAEDLYLQRLEDDPFTQIAADNGVVLLDGSDSRFQWEDVPGARDPGLVPYEEMPMIERSDYVFNANDSFWMPHATEMLDGDYSILHGRQQDPRSVRTRENAFVLSGADADTPGEGRAFSGEELRDAAFANMAGTARLLVAPVVERCTGIGSVEVPPLTGPDGDEPELPGDAVDVTAACDLLAGWDGLFDLDSSGAVLWREFLSALRHDLDGGYDDLWADPFDPDRPLETPAGLAPAPQDGDDPVLVALARAVQTLDAAGHDVDVPLGDLQYAPASGERIPLHGGTGAEGITNMMTYSDPSTTLEPRHEVGEPFVTGSALRPDGYPVGHGTSFIMHVDYTGDDVEAWAILTYGQTGEAGSAQNDAQTQRFSDKDWRSVAFREDDIAADPELTEIEVSG